MQLVVADAQVCDIGVVPRGWSEIEGVLVTLGRPVRRSLVDVLSCRSRNGTSQKEYNVFDYAFSARCVCVGVWILVWSGMCRPCGG